MILIEPDILLKSGSDIQISENNEVTGFIKLERLSGTISNYKAASEILNAKCSVSGSIFQTPIEIVELKHVLNHENVRQWLVWTRRSNEDAIKRMTSEERMDFF